MLSVKNSLMGMALALSLPGWLPAQTTFARITGTVTDPAGASVPKVTITARNVTTNVESTTKSNEAGIYTLATLKEGVYTLRAESPGFKEFLVENLKLAARDYRRVDVHLVLGEVRQTVEVKGGATLIETETARISDTKSAEQLKVLNQNWFRFSIYYLALSPNLTKGDDGSFRFAGSRDNQSSFSIDGSTAGDGVSSFIGPQFGYLESVQELKVGTANNSAEYGPLGQFTLISKSGTNQFHGAVFDYYVSPFLRARNPFAAVRDPGIQHFPGFAAGGPVYLPKIYNGKNKTFVYGSYETSRGNSTAVLLDPTVPIAAWRNGDFSSVGAVVFDPLNGLPFGNNRIPQTRLNSVSAKIQDRFYPLPNYGATSVFDTQNYRESKRQSWQPVSLWTLRGDHHFSENDLIYGRLTGTRGYFSFFDGNLPTIGRPQEAQRDTRSVTGSYTHVFNPRMMNEFRYGLAFNNAAFHGAIQGKPLVQDLGLQGLAPNLPDISGAPKIYWTNLPLQSIEQSDYADPSFRNLLNEFSDHLSLYRGRHGLKLGFTFTRVTWSDYSAPPCIFGCLTFSDRFTGFDYADFLLGYPTTVQRNFPPLTLGRRRNQYDFYALDDWKVTPALTLNLGIRYEYHPYWTEQNGLASMFDIGSGKIVVPDGALSHVSPLFPTDYVGVVGASTVGLDGSSIMQNDKNNVAPRIGVAYRPWGNNTVLRAGFGLYYDMAPRDINFGGLPFVLDEPAYTNPAANATVVLPQVFPSSGSNAGITQVSIPSAFNTNLKTPYSLQYNFTIEHSRWGTGFRLSYIGTANRQGEWSYDINSPVPDATPYIQKPRRFLNYPSIGYLTNGAGHQYNAFTAQVERPMARGLSFQTFWTWARDIGDLGRYQSSENPYDRHRERSVISDVPTQRFNISFLYQLPFGKGRQFLGTARRPMDLLAGGWEIAGIFTADTGRFLTPSWCGPDPTGTAFTGSIDPAFVCIRPDELHDPNLPKSERTLQRWFDPTAFAAPPLGRFGNSAKGVIKAPGTNLWNATFAKNFVFREGGAKLRLELMARNLFNHPNWSPPVTNINGGAAGRIFGAFGNFFDFSQIRQFRAGARFEW